MAVGRSLQRGRGRDTCSLLCDDKALHQEFPPSLSGHASVTMAAVPSGAGGFTIGRDRGSKNFRSGGARKVVTMTISVTALNILSSKIPVLRPI